jgi:hypothetical protein
MTTGQGPYSALPTPPSGKTRKWGWKTATVGFLAAATIVGYTAKHFFTGSPAETYQDASTAISETRGRTDTSNTTTIDDVVTATETTATTGSDYVTGTTGTTDTTATTVTDTTGTQVTDTTATQVTDTTATQITDTTATQVTDTVVAQVTDTTATQVTSTQVTDTTASQITDTTATQVTDTTATQVTTTAVTTTFGPVAPAVTTTQPPATTTQPPATSTQAVVPAVPAPAAVTPAVTAPVTPSVIPPVAPPVTPPVVTPAPAAVTPPAAKTPLNIILETYKADRVSPKIDAALQLPNSRITDSAGNMTYASSRQRCLPGIKPAYGLGDLVNTESRLKAMGVVGTALGTNGYSSQQVLKYKLAENEPLKIAFPEPQKGSAITKIVGTRVDKYHGEAIAAPTDTERIVYAVSGYNTDGKRVASDILIIDVERVATAAPAPIAVVEDCTGYNVGPASNAVTAPAPAASTAPAPAASTTAPAAKPSKPVARSHKSTSSTASTASASYSSQPAANAPVVLPVAPVTVNMNANFSGDGMAVSTDSAGPGYVRQDNYMSNCSTTPCIQWGAMTNTVGLDYKSTPAAPVIDMSKAPKPPRNILKLGHE